MVSLSQSLRNTFGRGARKLRRRFKPYSDYDHTIPPEIKDDEFYELMTSLARTAPVQTILEIGSSNGKGSTSAFVKGIHDNPSRPVLFCIEFSRPRFDELEQRFGSDPQVRCFNVSSVRLERLPSEQEVADFYQSRDSKLKRVPLQEVLRWLSQDRSYISRTGNDQDGIRMIKERHGIDRFGMVLIDGSEFAGRAEFDDVYGADYLLLDDIGTFKNMANFERLVADPSYLLLALNTDLRNGYAAFQRTPSSSSPG